MFRSPMGDGVFVQPMGGVAASGPTTLILDQFTGTNGTALASHTIAPTNTPAAIWTAPQYTIQSNAALHNNTGILEIAYCNAGTASVTITCLHTTDSFASTRRGGIVGRLSDTSNFWFLQLDISGTLSIIDVIAAVATVRATTSVTVAVSTAYLLRLVFSGTSITGTMDGANSINYVSAFNQAETKVGHRARNAEKMDNFTVTT